MFKLPSKTVNSGLLLLFDRIENKAYDYASSALIFTLIINLIYKWSLVLDSNENIEWGNFSEQTFW